MAKCKPWRQAAGVPSTTSGLTDVCHHFLVQKVALWGGCNGFEIFGLPPKQRCFSFVGQSAALGAQPGAVGEACTQSHRSYLDIEVRLIWV